MPKKQSGSDVSSLAGKYVRKTNAEFDFLLRNEGYLSQRKLNELFRVVRKLAASVLSQDEKPAPSAEGQKR